VLVGYSRQADAVKDGLVGLFCVACGVLDDVKCILVDDLLVKKKIRAMPRNKQNTPMGAVTGGVDKFCRVCLPVSKRDTMDT
jgi:hypothetical protein